MALKQPHQHYVKKTFEEEDLEMAKRFSDRAFHETLGISENVSGHHETLVSQFFSGEASTQVKNLFLVGWWLTRKITLVVESSDVGERWGREDMVLDMSRESYRELYLRVAANFKGAVYLVNVKLSTEEEKVWWKRLRISSTAGTPPISLFFLHRCFGGGGGAGDSLMGILDHNKRTRNLILYKSDISLSLGSSMAKISLDTLHLEDVHVDPEFIKALDSYSITHSLTLALEDGPAILWTMDPDRFLDRPRFLIDFDGFAWNSYHFDRFLEGQLKYLSLSNFLATPKDLIQFMSCLKDCTNTPLFSLSLSNLALRNLNAKKFSALITAVVDALHYSGLPFLYLDDISDPAIEAQLLLNQQRLSKLGSNLLPKSNKVPATAVRLFICGDAYAGKTTLLSTLSSVCSQGKGMKFLGKVKAFFTSYDASHTMEHIKRVTLDSTLLGRTKGVTEANALERTRGIEVHAIIRDGIRVSAWDMAGQKEFHAFHDLMFPDSSASSPAMFMFVWSPMDTKDQNMGKVRTKDEFEASFSYWLKFIASKTRQSSILRKLFVVLTRKDQLELVHDALDASIDAVASSFGKIIKVVEVVEVDARSPTSVKPLAAFIFDAAKEALNGVMVHALCNQVSKFLSSRHAHDSSAQGHPIISWTTFSELCEDKFNVFDPDVQKAIAYSLNESGDIIYLSNLSSIVLDPSWFCHEVMGSLIHFPEASTSQNLFPIDGYTTQHHLEVLLQRSTHSTVEGSVLVDLMEAMHLCCKDSGRVFIPATLTKTNQHDGEMHLHWRGAMDGSFQEYAYIGRRLECDKKDLTFLTPGLFPMIQAVFKKAFFLSKADVKMSRDVISIFMQDMEIMVELGLAKGQHVIDVMVRAPNQGDIGNTLTYVEDEIIKTLIGVCAQPVGNQGVKLVEGVIRPDCLRDPAPSHVREDQCVLVVDLKQKLRKQLEEGRPQEKLLHLWVGNNYVQPVVNRLIDLLGFEKYKEVLIAYESSLQDALLLSHSNGKAGADSVALSTSSNVDKGEVESGSTSTCDLHRLTEESPEASIDESGEEIVMAVSKSMVRALNQKLDAVDRKLDAVVDANREMKSKLDAMCHKLDVVHSIVGSLRSDVLPKIQKIVEQSLTFAVESEAGKVPRYVIVTTSDDSGTMRKMVTAVFKGLSSVCIELFCEHRKYPHCVNGQKGLCITAMDEGALIKRALPYVNGLLKALTLVAKVGAHAVAGAGSLVPDFSELVAVVLDTPGFLDNQGLFRNVSTSASPADAFAGYQQWLVSVLQRHGGMEEANIYNKFKLRRALYHDTKKVAWLCDTHYEQEHPLPLV